MLPFMLPYLFTHGAARRQRFGEDNDAFNFGADQLFGADVELAGYTPDGQPVLRPGRRPMPPWAGHRCGPPRAELGADDDVLGADDLDELGAIDAEIMGADDGDDDDDDDVIGGTKKVTRKIKDLEQTLAKLQRRYANTPPTRTQKRKHLQERIAHVQMLLSQKRRTKAQKEATVKGAFGKGPDGGGMQRAEQMAASLEADKRLGLAPDAPGIPGVRTQIKLLDSDDSEQFPSFSFAALGVGQRAVSINLANSQDSYQRLQVVGVEFDVKFKSVTGAGAPAPDLQPYLVLNTLQADGMADQVSQTAMLEIEWSGNAPPGSQWGKAKYTGLRDKIFLDKRDTVAVNVSVYQARSNTDLIEGTLGCNVLCNIVSDRK